MKTRIKCDDDVEISEIEMLIVQLLCRLPEISVKYDSSQHKWLLVIVKGSTTSNVEINIYEDFNFNDDAERIQYIVEVNKLKGSTDLHQEFFKQVQSSLLHLSSLSSSSSSRTSSTKFSSLSTTLSSSSDRELDGDPFASTKSIDPIHSPYNLFSDILGGSDNIASTESLLMNLTQLVFSGLYESMVRGSDLIYDLSLHHAYFDFVLTNEAAVFDIINKLLNCDIVEVKRNTVFSLTSLSESQLFQGKLISYGVLLSIFPLLSPEMASYDSIDICRTSAFVVANLAQSCPVAVMNSLGLDYFKHWYQSTKTIDDRNLQMFVDRIAKALLKK